MSTIIQALQESVEYSSRNPATLEMLQRLNALQDKIKAEFGMPFLNEYSDAWNDIHLDEIDRAYEHGFLTAFRLWMEVSAIELR